MKQPVGAAVLGPPRFRPELLHGASPHIPTGLRSCVVVWFARTHHHPCNICSSLCIPLPDCPGTIPFRPPFPTARRCDISIVVARDSIYEPPDRLRTRKEMARIELAVRSMD